VSSTFRLLSAGEFVALSIWELKGAEVEIAAALGCEGFPSEGDFPLIKIRDANGDEIDQGVFWVRERGAIARVELHLHGGKGVKQAFANHLKAQGWKSSSLHCTASYKRFLKAASPLAARAWYALASGGSFVLREALQAMPPSQRKKEARRILSYSYWAQILECPPAVVLAGPPNAGKSTLFNAWLGRRRVVVSPHPGTTRDCVEASIVLGKGDDAFEVRLVDTAGIWDEAVGDDSRAIGQSRQALREAWRIVWVLDASVMSRVPWEEGEGGQGEREFLVLNKCDIGSAWSPPGVVACRGSALTNGAAMAEELERCLLNSVGVPPANPAKILLETSVRETLQAWASD